MTKKCKDQVKKDKMIKERIEEEKEFGLKWYSFPKEWITIKARSREEAEKKMKSIQWYRNKAIV